MHLQEWGKAILQAAVIIVILFFFCWPMRISGSSMESTMKDGEIVLMSRFATMQEKYETGDIVMFHYYDADGGKTVVKRIIATEGDHIRILADGHFNTPANVAISHDADRNLAHAISSLFCMI